MYRVFLCILIFGLCPIVHGSDDPHQGITITVMPKEVYDTVMPMMRSDRNPDEVGEALVVRDFHEPRRPFSRHASFHPSQDVFSPWLEEVRKQAAEIQVEYFQLLDTVKNPRISDGDLFEILRKQTFSDTDLDDLHHDLQQSLAVALMKVTRPRDAVYRQNRIVKGSVQDKFSNCFRDLGNELFPLDWGGSYPASLTFKGSELAKRFNLIQVKTGNSKKGTSSCCVMQ